MVKLILFILRHQMGKEFNPSANIKFYYLQYILNKKKLLSIKCNDENNINNLIELVLLKKLNIEINNYNIKYYRDFEDYKIFLIELNNKFSLNKNYISKIGTNFEIKTTIYPLYNIKTKSIYEELMERLDDKLDIKNNDQEQIYLRVTNILKLLIFND